MRHAVCILAVALNVSVSNMSASAVAIYSSFGPGDSFSNDGAWSIGGVDSVPGGYQSVAGGFTVTGGNCQLGTIEVATVWEGGTNSLVVSLAENNSGVPGTFLESFNLENLMTHSPGNIITMSSVTHPLLGNGSFYWVVVQPGASDTSGGWWDASPHVEGRYAWNDGTGWVSATGGVSAFRVSDNSVPEPAAVSLLLLGGAALLRRRRTA